MKINCNSIPKRIIAIIVAIVIVVSTAVTVYAVDVEDEDIATYVASVSKSVNGQIKITNNKVKAWLHEDSTGIADPQTLTVTVNGATATFYMSPAEKTSLMRHIERQQESAGAQDKITGLMDGFKLKADVESASEMLSGFHGVASLITGIICYVVVLGMGVYAGFDILYIAFPLFRQKCQGAVESGNSMLTKQSSSGETVLRWVTDDAQYVVQTCSIESGKSPWLMYLKKRILANVMLAIVMYMLFTGNIDIIVRIALNFAEGIINSLSNLAA